MTKAEAIARIEQMGGTDVWFLSRPHSDDNKRCVGVAFYARGAMRRSALTINRKENHAKTYLALVEWAENGFARNWNRHG